MPKIFAGNPSVLCFRKFPVGKKFMDKRGGEYQDFPSKIFCLTWPKSFVGESFTVALISGIENFGIKGGWVSRFSVKMFLSHTAEIFRGGILYCCINFGYQKSLERRGGGWSIKMFRRSFLSHTAENFRTGNLYCCINFGYWESLDKMGANIKIFRRNFFVSECQKFP